MTGIEPASSVWKTEALPLSYIRVPGDRPVEEPLDGRGPWCHSARRHSNPVKAFPSVGTAVHEHQRAVVVGLLHRVQQHLRTTVEAPLEQALPQAGELVDAERDVAP